MKPNPITALLKQFAQHPIAYHRVHSTVAGGLAAGVLLSQLVYWWFTMNSKEFYATNKGLASDLGMTLAELRGAKAKVLKTGIVTIQQKGWPKRTHYSLDCGKLTKAICECSGQVDNQAKNTVGLIQPTEKPGQKHSTPENARLENQPKTPVGRIQPLSGSNTPHYKGTETNHRLTTTTVGKVKIPSKPKTTSILVKELYEYWNSRAGKPWWHHRELTPDLKQAIKAALKDYSVEDICRAIDNYQAVLQRPEYFWSKKWNLGEFLMRRQGTGKRATDPHQWWRFLGNNFDAEEYKQRSYNGQDGPDYPTEPPTETLFERKLKADKQRKLEEAASNAG